MCLSESGITLFRREAIMSGVGEFPSMQFQADSSWYYIVFLFYIAAVDFFLIGTMVAGVVLFMMADMLSR